MTECTEIAGGLTYIMAIDEQRALFTCTFYYFSFTFLQHYEYAIYIAKWWGGGARTLPPASR